MLTFAIFLPIIAAVALAVLPRAGRFAMSEGWMRAIATIVAAIPLGILALAWARFQGGGGFEQVESVDWIPTLGIAYRVGLDGLSLPLAAMTALLFVVSIAYPVDFRGRSDPGKDARVDHAGPLVHADRLSRLDPAGHPQGGA